MDKLRKGYEYNGYANSAYYIKKTTIVAKRKEAAIISKQFLIKSLKAYSVKQFKLYKHKTS
jgi:hypothetical protein